MQFRRQEKHITHCIYKSIYDLKKMFSNQLEN